MEGNVCWRVSGSLGMRKKSLLYCRDADTDRVLALVLVVPACVCLLEGDGVKILCGLESASETACVDE